MTHVHVETLQLLPMVRRAVALHAPCTPLRRRLGDPLAFCQITKPVVSFSRV